MTTNAYRDENNVPTLIGASSADGTTIVRMQANPSNHKLQVAFGTTGIDHGTTNASRDENSVPVFMAVSSVDGKTPVEVYVDPITGRLLIDSV